MVHIVTGKINSGKTTFLLAKYLSNPVGDGFISLKTMDHFHVRHYDALRLSTNQETLLAVHEKYLKEEVIKDRIGPYGFIKSTIEMIELEIEKLIQAKIQPIYLDEIGVLELEDKGFSTILRKMISSELDLILSIREDLIPKITHKYGIEQFETITEL